MATLLLEAKTQLLAYVHTLCDFLACGHWCSIKEFQSFTGYLNWAFNVYPLLKPGLASTYAKLKGKSNLHTSLHLNKAIISELSWIASHIEQSSGVCFLDAEPWGAGNLVASC